MWSVSTMSLSAHNWDVAKAWDNWKCATVYIKRPGWERALEMIEWLLNTLEDPHSVIIGIHRGKFSRDKSDLSQTINTSKLCCLLCCYHFLLKYYRRQAVSLTSKPPAVQSLLMQGHNAEYKVIRSLQPVLNYPRLTELQFNPLGLCLNSGFPDIWAHLEIQSVSL